ncbi:MAG: class I SAM-dependent methyltransferase [Syntrophaceae bacterium]|nr:class I SAM-dependent methyltransferase [Syntrophaceae bacterium]
MIHIQVIFLVQISVNIYRFDLKGLIMIKTKQFIKKLIPTFLYVYSVSLDFIRKEGIFLNRIKPEEFRQWNELMVKKYDPDAFHKHPNPFVRFIERKRVKTIIKLLKTNKDDRVIEVGCGAGNVIKDVTEGKLFGVDISSFILGKANQKLKGVVHFFQADVQNLPCKDEIFTHIICSEVLEHLLDPLIAIHEMKRTLDFNGVAVISIPNEIWINRTKRILIKIGIFNWLLRRKAEYGEMPERMEDEWHLHTYTLKMWRSLFAKSFKVTRVKRIPFFWFPLRYVIRLKKN